MVAGSETAAPTRIAPALLARARRAGRALLDRLGDAKVILLKRLPQRFHAITDEMAKFGTVGLINLGVNFAVFNALLVLASGSEVKAKAVATMVATTCAYFLNRHWTYRHRPKTTLRREYSLFFFFNAVGLVIEAGIVALAKYGFDQTSLVVLNVCTFVGIAIGTVFRFWAYRTHVFKQAPGPQPAPALPAPAPVLAAPTLAGAQLATAADLRTGPAVRSSLAGARRDAPDPRETRDDELREEMVQLELDEMLAREPVAADANDPAARH